MTERSPAHEVAEACADALLAAVALLLIQDGSPVTFHQARLRAIAVLDEVLARTEREGARSR